MTWKAVVCTIAVIFGGCPKRQTGPQIVYVPSPPPASAPSQSDQTLIVQAPAPPAPTEVAPQPPPRVTPEPAPSRPPQPKRAGVKSPPEEETAEVPALQTALSPSQASELRNQVFKLQEGIEKRIELVSKEWLSPGERSTLETARGFLQQSQKALQESDLQRADNLAHKADVLITSLEQSR